MILNALARSVLKFTLTKAALGRRNRESIKMPCLSV